MTDRARAQKIILIIDDDDSWFKMAETLLKFDYQVQRAKTREEAETKITSDPEPDLVLANRTLTEYDDRFGVDILKQLRVRYPALPLIVATGHAFDIELLECIDLLKIALSIPKSQFNTGQLRDIIKKILEAKNRKPLVSCEQLHNEIPRYLLHSYQNKAFEKYHDLHLFKLTIENYSDEDLEATLTCKEHTYIQNDRHPFQLKKGRDNYYYSPIFKGEAGESGAIIAVTELQVLLGEQVIWDSGGTYKFRVGHTVPILLKQGATGDIWTQFLIATCITPDSSEVKRLAGQVRKAWDEKEKRHGKTRRASRYIATDPDEYAQDLRNILNKELIREGDYHPDDKDDKDLVSHTMRLPDEIIQNKGANCLYYSLLYASVLENLGIYPLLLFKLGHVLPGWKKEADDRPYEFTSVNFESLKERMVFIESTLTSTDDDFSVLLDRGKEEFQEAQELAKSEKPVYILDVKRMRHEGFAPYEGKP